MSFGAIIRIGEVPLATATEPDSRRGLQRRQEFLVAVRLDAILRMNKRRMFDAHPLPCLDGSLPIGQFI